jgi:hypothetical protein
MLTLLLSAQSLEAWHTTGKAEGQPRPKALNVVVLTGPSSFSSLPFLPFLTYHRLFIAQTAHPTKDKVLKH